VRAPAAALELDGCGDGGNAEREKERLGEGALVVFLAPTRWDLVVG
jgi:hypothetical protein